MCTDICNSMGGHGGSYTKWNKTEKDRNYMFSLTWNIKETQNKKAEVQRTDQQFPEEKAQGEGKNGYRVSNGWWEIKTFNGPHSIMYTAIES